jgi:replicative DNA helicase
MLEIRSREMGINMTGVPSGITELDRITLGWQPSDLIIIGARPSVGKTAFALQLAINAAYYGYKTMFFSLEMNSDSISVRILTNKTEIFYNDIKQNKPENNKAIDKVIDQEFTNNLFIDDAVVQTAFSIRARLKKFVKNGGRLAVIDYLQLMKGHDKLMTDRNRYIGEITKNLKQTARELKIPIIILSQLNRDVEKRGLPFPVLQDLRDSGEIEQDADIVIFPTRYAKLPDKFVDETTKNKARIEIAKNRNGAVDVFDITVSDDKSRWMDTETINF